MSTLNPSVPQAMELLTRRRSVKAHTLQPPAPTEAEVLQILTAAARVSDHGKLFPWRFIRIWGAARERMGQILVDIARKKGPLSPDRETAETSRFLRAPLIIAVVSHISHERPIPEWEQILSSGAVCQNMLLATHALGYAAVWLTEWYAYDADVLTELGLTKEERIAGFIYIGTPSEIPLERARPDIAAITTDF